MRCFAASLFLILATAFPARADNYTLDPDHTHIIWHVSHFGLSNPSGNITGVEGRLVLDERDPQNSKLNVVI